MSNNYTASAVAPSTTWAQILPFNQNRTALTIVNNGTVDVLFGITETTAFVIPVGKGISFERCEVPLNALGAKVASGTGGLVIWES